jgi:hypothetical protein
MYAFIQNCDRTFFKRDGGGISDQTRQICGLLARCVTRFASLLSTFHTLTVSHKCFVNISNTYGGLPRDITRHKQTVATAVPRLPDPPTTNRISSAATAVRFRPTPSTIHSGQGILTATITPPIRMGEGGGSREDRQKANHERCLSWRIPSREQSTQRDGIFA